MECKGVSLKVAEFNCNSLYARQEVNILLDKYALDILLCNDTRLNSGMKVEFDGYSIERTDKADGSRKSGGVAAIIKSNISYSRIDIRAEEAICVEILMKERKFRLSTTYIHPGNMVQQHFIDDITNNDGSLTANVSMSDWNAHVGLDEGVEADAAGEVLLDKMEKSGFTLVNDSEPTYFSSNSSAYTCIDLCFLKRPVNDDNLRTSWRVLDHHGSDHLPTLLELSIGKIFSSNRKKIDIVSWQDYCDNLTADLNHLDSLVSLKKDGPEAYAKAVEELMVLNKNNATRSIKARMNGGTVLSKRTRIMIETRRKLLKMRRRNDLNQQIVRGILNDLSKEIKKAIKRDRDEQDMLKAESIMNEADSGKRWTKFKIFTGTAQTQQIPGTIFDENGHAHQDDFSKAEGFASKLERSHSFPTAANFDEIFRESVDEQLEGVFKHLEADMDSLEVPSEDLPPITPSEIEENLRKSKSKSAAGPDGVNYKMIKRGGDKLILVLCGLFNFLMMIGHHPLHWKEVCVKMLRKPGKDCKMIKNFRPISLSAVVGKLYESCLKTRLEKKLSRIKSENIYQAAYKSHRGTQEHLVRLTEEVTKALNCRQGVVAVFLDISGAFDKVWNEGLIYKMLCWGLGFRLARCVYSFLNNRRLRVKVGETWSRIIRMASGTPQGAVVSPIIFNSFVDDLCDLLPPEVQLGQYADDIALWIRSKDPKLAANAMQAALDTVDAWSSKWRIALEPTKSSCVVFTRCPTFRQTLPQFTLCGLDVKQEKTARFLGVLFQENLNWNKYIDDVIRRATSRIHIVKRLAAKDRWRSPWKSIYFFEALVRPLFDYGAICFGSVGNASWKKIDQLHGRFLKSVCNVPSRCSYERLLNQLHLEKLSTSIKTRASNRITSMCKTSPFGNDWVLNSAVRMEGKRVVKVPTVPNKESYQSSVRILLHLAADESEIKI